MARSQFYSIRTKSETSMRSSTGDTTVGGLIPIDNEVSSRAHWRTVSWCCFLVVSKSVHKGGRYPTSVARNDNISLNWRCYGPKQDIFDYWGTLIFGVLSYYILSMDKCLLG